jgi:hypothetical protein
MIWNAGLGCAPGPAMHSEPNPANTDRLAARWYQAKSLRPGSKLSSPHHHNACVCVINCYTSQPTWLLVWYSHTLRANQANTDEFVVLRGLIPGSKVLDVKL